MYVRRCKVIDDCGSRDGYFHRWVNYTGYIVKPNMVLSKEEMEKLKQEVEAFAINQVSVVPCYMEIKTFVKPMALVEFPDGSIKAIDVDKITFVDPPYYGQRKARGEE